MNTEDLLDFDAHNQDAYDDLIVTIEAKGRAMSLMIAVCDDLNLRDRIIAKYEAELQPYFRPYRVTLARGEPSLYDALAQLVQQEEYLRQGGKAIVTVTGSEQLYFLKLGNERSEQEIFFGYLQWTREGLQEFPYPIILWVTYQMLVNLIKKAPDFWSWREGVFRFVSRKTITVSSQEIEPIRLALNDSELSSINDNNKYFLPIEDLQQLIQQKEQQGTKDSSLATLYCSIGNIYRKRLEFGEFQDYQKELALAIQYFHKAIELQKELGLEVNLVTSLNNLAYLYDTQGRYAEAEPLYLQALELGKRWLGEDHPDVATSLNNLAALYNAQGRYNEAKPLYLQALELRKRWLGEDHPDVATSLNNLAVLYKAQGRYNEAEPLFLQALELRKRWFGEDHSNLAASLNNLAALYKAQGRYNEAELFYLQALELRKRWLGKDHPDVATSLNNLALLYKAQGRYNEAELLFLQALELRKRWLGEDHPNIAASLNNLALLYESQERYSEAEPLHLKALELYNRLLGEDHPDVATSLNNLALLYKAQGRYNEAEPLYRQALKLSKCLFGEAHPNVAASLNNLAALDKTQGRYKEAESLYLEALELSERALGVAHPNTIVIRKNLAILRDNMSTNFSRSQE